MKQRDARAANRLDPETLIVHRRLEAWARWSRETSMVGGSGTSPIARMMEFGINGAGASSAPVEMPDSISEIESAVGTIPKQEERAIRRYYLHWEPVEVSAGAMRVTVRELQRLLQKARWRIGITLDLNARNLNAR